MNLEGMNNNISISDQSNNCELLSVRYEGHPAYDIRFEKDFTALGNEIKKLGMEHHKFMIVTDSNVSKLYLQEVMNLLQPMVAQVYSFVFEAGEANKNLDTVKECYVQLIEHKFDRNDILIALGGGVVGDLTGYVAATYLRGIRFIQVPTTLLSMVDSSIGGKTGVDFLAYKNMVGAFHQPKLVYMNLDTLLSLDRDYYSGMGEIIKHGLIKDESYYQWLKANHKAICQREYDVLKEMIYRSCDIKRNVVENDPKELGERALLNFGHTIGHAVEKLSDFTLLHGECVAIGMVAATYLSHKKGYLNEKQLEDILDTISAFSLPISVSNLDPEEVYQVTRLDKKMDSDQIKFILLRSVGDSFIDKTLGKEEIIEAITYILK